MAETGAGVGAGAVTPTGAGAGAGAGDGAGASKSSPEYEGAIFAAEKKAACCVGVYPVAVAMSEAERPNFPATSEISCGSAKFWATKLLMSAAENCP